MCKQAFTAPEIEAFSLCHDKTSSKKDDETRKSEVSVAFCNELAKYYEEKMGDAILEAKPVLLRELLKYCIERTINEDLLE